MRIYLNDQAKITNVDINKQFQYAKVPMLTVEISYPQIRLNRNATAQNKINKSYKNTALGFYRYTYKTLFPSAIQNYKDAIENGWPFNAYDAVMKYTVTLNQNCHLSSYFDQYEYTGGAHGNTLRTADNWNLQTGDKVTMSSLFRRGENYKQIILSQILKQADANMAQNPGIYFENYPELIREYFNAESFYLTPVGLAVYYGQYEIAPYVTGIVVFEIPYETLGIQKPRCMG